MNKEQTERLLAMGQMAASMAHEIRNPLGGMELFCSLLSKELKEKDEKRLQDLADQILKGIRTVDRVIQNCLQFAREIVPRRAPVAELKIYLGEIAELVRARANDFGLSICLDVPDGLSAEFDPYLVEQALVNLLTNAVDAVSERRKADAREGKELACNIITLSAHQDCGTLVIEVKDGGLGIPDDVKARIFDPFMTTKTTGTGLGLAITHSIIRAHGGDILVESVQGVGSIFKIVLPQSSIFSGVKDSGSDPQSEKGVL